MPLGFEWKISSVSLRSSVHKSTKEESKTETVGTFTLSGSGAIKGATGDGTVGITIVGSGGTLEGSGMIVIDSGVPCADEMHTLTVRQEYPKSYECAHENCTVGLPNKYHHRVICQEDRWHESTKRRVTCRREYYWCQTTTCPLDSWHAVTYGCGETDKKGNASVHELQASCSTNITQNGDTVYCIVTGFYKCQLHTHVLPPPNTSGSSSSVLPPTPVMHVCSLHATTVSGDHSWIAANSWSLHCTTHGFYACQSSSHTGASCGISGHYICDSVEHVTLNCPTNSSNQSCSLGSYYACSPHTHQYPTARVPCGWQWCNKGHYAATETAHQATCPQGHVYWTCGVNQVNPHIGH